MRWCLAVCALTGCFTPELSVAPPPLDAETCRACAETACAATYSACVDEPACAEILECALACPPEDQGCVVGCGTESPDGQQAALDLLDCVEVECPEDCASLAAP